MTAHTRRGPGSGTPAPRKTTAAVDTEDSPDPQPVVEVDAASPATTGIAANPQPEVESVVRQPRPSTEAHLAALTAALPDDLVVPIVEGGGRWPIIAVAARDDLAEALGAIVTRPGSHLYVAACPMRADVAAQLRRGTGRGKAADAAALTAVWADIDVAGPAHKTGNPLPPDLDAAVAVLDDLPVPSLLVATGNGIQPWWLLDEPWIVTDQNRHNVEVLALKWERTVAHHAHRAGFTIDSVGDLARVLRVAGTANRKPNAPPRRAGLLDVGGWPVGGLLEHGWLWRPGVRYRLRDLVTLLDPLVEQPRRQERPRPTAPARSRLERLGRRELNILDAVNAAPWADIWPSDWDYVGTATVDGEVVELWRRPGATSDYSVKCWSDGGAMLWSDGVADLKGGKADGRYSKADVLAWRFGVNLSELSRRIIADARGVSA